MKMYVNENIPSQFKYLGNMTNTYFDLYDTNNPAGRTVQYYRVFYSYDDNFYIQYQQTYGSYNQYDYPAIERTTSVFSSVNNYKIFTICFIVVYLLIFICNVVTSIFKRGGIFAK